MPQDPYNKWFFLARKCPHYQMHYQYSNKKLKICDALHQHLKQKGWNTERLSAESGVDVSTIRAILDANKLVSNTIITKLFFALGIPEITLTFEKNKI